MHFELKKSLEILERTPVVLEYLLRGISDDWAMNDEGEETFSPYDVIGHLIHGEKTDWIARMEIILSDRKDREEGSSRDGEQKPRQKTFTPYDRFAQFDESEGKSLNDLLTEFKIARDRNIRILLSKELTDDDLDKTGVHPKFGTVTLRQLLSTWTVHDLTHLAQISRVMAKQYKDEVGPWIDYLPLLTK